jgi:uncharacterized protein
VIVAHAARSLLLAALLVLGALCWGQVAVPQLRARVNDLTGTLSASQREALEQKLTTFETRKGAQIFILVLPSVQPETVAEFGVRVFDAWKIGRKNTSDGVLLLIAKDDRKLNITVGRGLEGALTDADSKRIIAEVITPLFKHGDFFGGIDAGAERIMKVVDGEPLPKPQPRQYNESDWGSALPLAILIAFVSGAIFRAVFGRFPGALAAGGLTGAVTWFVLGALGVAGFAALLAFMFNLFAGAVPGASGWASRGRRYDGWGGWGGGGWGGGGGFGGGGGGGGFSGGGGGDTAGGGASGSW